MSISTSCKISKAIHCYCREEPISVLEEYFYVNCTIEITESVKEQRALDKIRGRGIGRVAVDCLDIVAEQ